MFMITRDHAKTHFQQKRFDIDLLLLVDYIGVAAALFINGLKRHFLAPQPSSLAFRHGSCRLVLIGSSSLQFEIQVLVFKLKRISIVGFWIFGFERPYTCSLWTFREKVTVNFQPKGPVVAEGVILNLLQ